MIPTRLPAAGEQGRAAHGVTARTKGGRQVRGEDRVGPGVLDDDATADDRRDRLAGRDFDGRPLDRLELLGGEAHAGRRGHQVAPAVVEHQDAPVRALEPRHRREDLLQDRRQFEAVREARAQGVEACHVGELDRQLVPDRGELVLVPLALDRRGQDVGHGLEEVDVVGREGPRPAVEDPQGAEGPLAAWMMTLSPLTTPCSRSRGETANLVSVAEVLDDHRLAGQQGEARQRRGPRATLGASVASRPASRGSPARRASRRSGASSIDDRRTRRSSSG